ncbi:MAG: hypothetical protein ABEL97_07815 [Salinibacter sp.]
MSTRRTCRWKRALGGPFPFLFTECPSGTYHWFFERWCQCEHREDSGEDAPGPDPVRGGVFDLRRWEEARQGPEGYRPGNRDVQIGDYVQPEGLELRPPLAWKVVGFEARGDNPKYTAVLEYPLSGDRIALDNLPKNARPPGEANDPRRIGSISEVRERRPIDRR